MDESSCCFRRILTARRSICIDTVHKVVQHVQLCQEVFNSSLVVSNVIVFDSRFIPYESII